MSVSNRNSGSRAEVVPIGEPEIRQLLEGAGPRPEVPAEEMARIRSAAREEWRRQVAARRRFWRQPLPLVAAAMLALAVGAGWMWLRARPQVVSGPLATVERIEGTVFAARTPAAGGGEIAPLALGRPLSAGAAIATVPGPGGAPSRVALRLADGRSLRLDTGTRVRLLDGRRVELERGGLYIDAGPEAPPASSVEVLTRLGSVREIGTQFEVRLVGEEGDLRVRVREGAVAVRHDGESLTAAAGEEVTLRPDGSVERRRVEPFAAFWDWASSAAPALDIEGIALASFLEWVSRETGLEVDFADAGLRSSAAGIELHGTIEGLTPQESLSVVLPGSGLLYRVEEGRLRIRRGG